MACCDADMRRIQALRAVCFDRVGPFDADGFDADRFHVLVEERDSDTLVCCFRLLPLSGGQIAHSYAAQFYGLERLSAYPEPMMELGRFCVHPQWVDPDIIRLAWAMMTDQVDRRGVRLLFGCSSFEGVDPALYRDALALLKARHLAPDIWRPSVKAEEVFCYGTAVQDKPDVKKAMQHMPPLLRSYLMMGGWVSDHAVVDRQMNTLHVFTGLEIGAIPEQRKRLLRALI
jgi:putative hemolysin